MKVTQERGTFRPVTITLETLEEVETLYQLGNCRGQIGDKLGDCAATYSPTRSVPKDQIRSVLQAMYEKLGTVLN